jgi:hypothetical protein
VYALKGTRMIANSQSEEELTEQFSGVALNHTNKEFYRGLLSRELRINRCRDCGWWHQPHMPICPRCWSRSVEATRVSGDGVIHLVTFLYQGPPTDGVTYTPPHPVVAVELAEQMGLRFTSTVIGADNDLVVPGRRVELDWISRAGRPFPAFRLVDQT